MTRGRKKDLTIPPSRALTQQRDYRARKAQYITDLEERCKRAEDDNARLRKELELVRAGALAGSASVSSPETARASSDLMQQLAAASAALARFQQLAFTGVTPQAHFQRSPVITSLRPAQFPPSHNATLHPSPPPRFNSNYKRLFNEAFPTQLDSPKSISSNGSQASSDPIPPRVPGGSPTQTPDYSGSPSSESDCCGGIMDCDELIEENEHYCSPRRRRSTSRTPPQEGFREVDT